jgi:hypothetical protein
MSNDGDKMTEDSGIDLPKAKNLAEEFLAILVTMQFCKLRCPDQRVPLPTRRPTRTAVEPA